jgi:hypothetical protein
MSLQKPTVCETSFNKNVISIELEWEKAGREREILDAPHSDMFVLMQIVKDFSSPCRLNPPPVRSTSVY